MNRLGKLQKLGRTILFLGFAIFFSTPLVAGRYAESMFHLGTSSRGVALGNATGALFEDGAVFLQNPANLSYLTQVEFRGMYTTQFGLANYNHLGAAIPVQKDFTVSLNWLRFAVDGIPLRPDLSQYSLVTQRDSARALLHNGLGTFEDREDAVFLSVARLFKWNLDLGWRYFELPVETPVGINLKYLNRKIYNVSGSGLGVDLSAGLKFHLRDLLDVKWMGTLGNALMLQDVTGTPVSWNTKSQDVMRPAVQWHLSYEQPLPWKRSSLNFVTSRSSRYGSTPGTGIEFVYNEILAIQVGKRAAQWSGGMTFYTLIQEWPVGVEYSFGHHDLGFSHRLGMIFRLK